MRLHGISLREVSGALPRPVGNPEQPEQRRAGLVLGLTDAEGNVGLGEASPLPGFSRDSLESCRVALRSISARPLEDCLSGPGSLLDRLTRASALLPPGSPAAAFALETALLDLASQRDQSSPFELLERPALPQVELNAVLDGTLPDARDHALALVQRGYSTLKVKFGARWEPALELLSHLAELPGIRLRADANRGLRAEDLERALPRLAALGLEFLEEPCAPELWPALPPVCPPLALDETLGSTDSTELAALLRAARADVVVLKPMALGGFSECLRLADTARALGSRVVVTHLFDGPIGLSAASVLALAVQSPRLAAGLAPHAGLAAWPAASRGESGPRLAPGAFATGISPRGYWQVLGD